MPGVFVEEEPTTQLRELYRYWDRIRRGRAMPARRDVEPTDIPRLLPHVTLVDVVGDPPRFRKRLVGTAIVAKEGRETTGAWLDEAVKPDVRAEVLAHHARTVTERRMTCYRADFLGNDKILYRYQRILMPLSCDGIRVNMLLGGAVFSSLGA